MLERLLGTQEDIDLITGLCADIKDTQEPYCDIEKGLAVSSTSRELTHRPPGRRTVRCGEDGP